MPVSFNNLGNMGRLGNQMFQYASLQGIAKNRGFDWKIPPENKINPAYKNSKSSIYDCFYLDQNIKSHIDETSFATMEESKHGFDNALFDSCPDNVDLVGYFQSYKYFKHIEEKIRRDFTFTSSMLEIIPQKNTLSIHVRRSDYLSFPDHHPVLGEDYYRAALDSIGSFSEAIVFSDDIEWCKNIPLFKQFSFSLGDPYSDLKLMSRCENHIIANSSFSWWGAWLSRSDNVIAPKQWFGPALSNYDVSGYYLDEWMKI